MSKQRQTNFKFGAIRYYGNIRRTVIQRQLITYTHKNIANDAIVPIKSVITAKIGAKQVNPKANTVVGESHALPCEEYLFDAA